MLVVSRSCREFVASLPSRPSVRQTRDVDFPTTLALVLVGSGAIVAGTVGLLIPTGERLAAALTW